MLLIILFIIATLSYILKADNYYRETKRAGLPPDAGLNAVEIILRNGYPVEQHKVTTPDGYILEVHRIPHGLNNANETKKSVIFLQHGLLSSSAEFVNNGEKSLAYILANSGYDVWMGNSRGNTWSRNHVSLDPEADKEKFWSFSWDEVGRFDLPKMIDLVLKKTGVDKIYYVGHSQGTTAFFVMASEKPEYNHKIKLMSALAPVAYMSNINFPIKLIALQENSLYWLSQMIGLYEFLPNLEFLKLAGMDQCKDKSLFQEVCSNIFFLISGFDSQELNKTLLPVYLTNFPAGGSTKQIVHYGQEINSKKFRKFDYGVFNNLNRYGSIEPPDYDISKITAPIALFYSENDNLVGVKDVERFADELPNLALKHKVTLPEFNHLDFVLAIHAKELVYDFLLDIMDQYK